MDLYLIRHGLAFDQDPERWPSDGERPLTKKGMRQCRKDARGLRALVEKVDVLLASSLVRAWSTAEILSEHAKWPAPIAFPLAEPGHSAAEAVVRLNDYAESSAIGIVGHEPGLHELLAYFVLGSDDIHGITLPKGGVARIEVDADFRAGGGTLHWLVPPEILRKLN